VTGHAPRPVPATLHTDCVQTQPETRARAQWDALALRTAAAAATGVPNSVPPADGGPWRPLTDGERVAAVALGHVLRQLRVDAGLSARQLGEAAQLGRRQVQRLEAGQRRTRASTLARLARALTRPPADVPLALWLVRAAGPALAPESPYAVRVDRRRETRHA
jgi:transcriptional regulator with XRE-family HTH domain